MTSEVYTSVIVTHQARLRCLMDRFNIGKIDKKSFVEKEDLREEDSFGSSFDNQMNRPFGIPVNLDRNSIKEPLLVGGALFGNKNKKSKGEIARFKNGCVLKLTITSSSIQAELVIDGYVDEAKPGYIYYTNSINSLREKHVHEETMFSMEQVDNNFYDKTLIGNDIYEFYLIRHGQAEHNVLKGMSKAFSNKDTSLTSNNSAGCDIDGANGICQAQKVGTELRRYTDEEHDSPTPFHYLFASDLVRTRETLANILTSYPDYFSKYAGAYEITILPCAHELKYSVNSETGKCDGKSQPSITPSENTMVCTKEKCGTTTALGNPNMTLKNNWNDYYDFYGSSTRSGMGIIRQCKFCKVQHCRNSDMLEQAMLHIKKDNTTERQAFSGRLSMDSGESMDSGDMGYYTPRSSMGMDRSSIDSTASTVVLGGVRRRRRITKKRRSMVRKRKGATRKKKVAKRSTRKMRGSKGKNKSISKKKNVRKH
jgi:hypothetical protein